MIFDDTASAGFRRATERARAVLKAGDRLTMGHHGRAITVTFRAWVDHRGIADPNGQCIASRTIDDLAAWNVSKVNGSPVNFRDADAEASVAANRARFDRERAHDHALAVQRRRVCLRAVAALTSQRAGLTRSGDGA